MNAVILAFPKIHKRAFSKCDIEKYIELVEKISTISRRQTMLLDSLDNRIFSGVHNAYGPICEQVYKQLLSYYNNPSIDNWELVKYIPIFYNITVDDCWKDYNSSPISNDCIPSKETFLLCISLMKKEILLSNSKMLAKYKKELEELEAKNEGIKEAVIFRKKH